MSTKTLNHRILKKTECVAILRRFGVARDWEKVGLDACRVMVSGMGSGKLVKIGTEVLASMRGGSLNMDDVLIDAPEELPGDDEAVEYDGDGADHFEARTVSDAVVVREEPRAVRKAPDAAAPVAAKPQDVTQVAGLLAQLLATGKPGLDADEVAQIVAPMLLAERDMGARSLDNAIEKTTRAMLETVSGWIKEMPAREITIKTGRAEVRMDGLQHHQFERLLRCASATTPDGHRLNVYLYGPPGTGKTTAARNVATALSLPFHCNGSLSTKYELTGFIDANGVCHSPEFRKAWQSGGVYLFDEIDGSVSAAIVAFNAALANGVMAFPDGMLERHKDCVVIAAANTVHGATAEFTGRTKLDAATLDRFVMIEWGIDANLEEAMACGHEDWLRTVRAMRSKVADKGIKVMVTPRAVSYGAALLSAGMHPQEVRETVLRKGMNDQQWAMVA